MRSGTFGTGSEAFGCASNCSTALCARLYEQIAQPGTFLVSATRLGGQHGYDEAGATRAPRRRSGRFLQSLQARAPNRLVKAVDFEAQRKGEEIARLLIEETLRDPGAMEIGYKAGQRWTVGLQEQPAADGQPGQAE